jgi:hypothetical protein
MSSIDMTRAKELEDMRASKVVGFRRVEDYMNTIQL